MSSVKAASAVRRPLRGSWMACHETAYLIWRQVEAGVIDLSALEVATAGLQDPDAVLARAEATSGLAFVALTPGHLHPQ